MRVKMEFYCSGSCSKYFDFMLNTSLNGNHRIHCPNCGHVHFRVVKNGKITEDRFTDNPSEMIVDDIFPMKSSIRDEQKDTAKDMAMEFKDVGKPADIRAGFMRDLWREKFTVQT